jgi:transketolase
MRTFGESAPLQKLVIKFGFTVDAVVKAALEQVNKAKQ